MTKSSVGNLWLIFEQALVDIPQMTHVEIAVGNAFARSRGPRQEFNNLRQRSVTKFVLLKKRVMRWIEKPAVVLRDEVVPTVVDERK